MPLFRIRDLLASKTLITSERGRDLVVYQQNHYQPGRSDWWWQYQRADGGWAEIPAHVRRRWYEQSASKGAAQ